MKNIKIQYLYKILNEYYSLPLYHTNSINLTEGYFSNIDKNDPIEVEIFIAEEPEDMRIAMCCPTFIYFYFKENDYEKCIRIAGEKGKYCYRRTCYFYDIVRLIMLRKGYDYSGKYKIVNRIIENELNKGIYMKEWIKLTINDKGDNYNPLPPTPMGIRWKIRGEPPYQYYEEFHAIAQCKMKNTK